MIDCKHLSDCGLRDGGCCALGLYGGRPSAGTCGRCDQREPTGTPLTIRGIAHGAAGIAKAITGTGGASAELVAQRTAICAACPHAVLTAGVLERCELCGCATWAKVRNAAEQCPAGQWPPIP